MITPFKPKHALLRNPHVQTVIASSALRTRVVRRRAAYLIDHSIEHIINCGTADGEAVRLQAWLSLIHSPHHASANGSTGSESRPLVILIHGWLGGHESSYMLSAAVALQRAGFTVARLNLRDHGDTHHLNRELFHSARTQEVVDACTWLISEYGQAGTGLMGFSLGGNFVLRVAADLDAASPLRATLAVCPVIDPEPTMVAIDNGWSGYQWAFVHKWQRAMTAKEAAFPEHYDFSKQRKLARVSSLTDSFVEKYTDFTDTSDYLANYSLTGERLSGLTREVNIIAAADDPVIPASTFDLLPKGLPVKLHLQCHGGHCGFIEDFRLRSWVNERALGLFRKQLRDGKD